MKTKCVQFAWSAAALLLFACPALGAKEWLLTFAVSEETRIENPKTDPPKVERRSYTQTVALGQHYLAVQDDRLRFIYDFAARRSHKVGVGTNTLNAYQPLYGEVGILEDEARNRIAQGAGMRAAKITPMLPVFDRFEIETALRVSARAAPPDAPAPVIDQVKAGEAIEFRHGGQVVVRFAPAKTTLPPEFQRRFVNYLAYACAIHPKIRTTIAATGTLPEQLVFASQEHNGRKTVTVRLVSAVAADTDSSVAPANAKPFLDERDPFTAAFAAILEAERSGRRLTREETIAFAQKSVAERNLLDAMLALREYGLQSGTELTDEWGKYQARFARDPGCQAYNRGIIQGDQPTRESLEKNLASNAGIDRTKLRKGHMLDLQRASLLETLRRPQEALEHYFKMLRANPLHAATLSDLGLFYARGAQQPKAWFCWETALRLYPDHPFLKNVKGYGQRFETNYPDFF